MKKAVIALLASCFLMPMRAQEVIQSQRPEAQAYTSILHFTANVIDFICTARSLQKQNQITVSTVSNASPASFSATAHGIYFNAAGVTAKAVIFISGATSGWTGINGTWVATPTGANSFTIPVDTSAFGTFVGQTITVTTRAPLTTQAIWSVKEIVSDASGNPVMTAYRADSTPTTLATIGSGQTSFNATCAAPGAFQ